jgi:hypothetical protein
MNLQGFTNLEVNGASVLTSPIADLATPLIAAAVSGGDNANLELHGASLTSYFYGEIIIGGAGTGASPDVFIQGCAACGSTTVGAVFDWIGGTPAHRGVLGLGYALGSNILNGLAIANGGALNVGCAGTMDDASCPYGISSSGAGAFASVTDSGLTATYYPVASIAGLLANGHLYESGGNINTSLPLVVGGSGTPSVVLPGSSSGTATLQATAAAGTPTLTLPTFSGTLQATSVYTVSTLPSASSLPPGTMLVVSDASTFSVGTCTGGGGDYMIAVTSGSAWSCH